MFEQYNILHFPFIYSLQPNVSMEFRTHIGKAAVSAAKVTYLILLHDMACCDLRYRFDILMFFISLHCRVICLFPYTPAVQGPSHTAFSYIIQMANMQAKYSIYFSGLSAFQNSDLLFAYL